MIYNRGFKLYKKKLKHWVPLCEEWLLSIERYSRIMEGGDAAFGYNERANIGLLAGAAIRCGSIALEEFQSTKLHDKEEKRGRADLWICNENSQEEIIEAKFKWLSLNSRNEVTLVQGVLNAACDDAIKSRCGDKDVNGVGVAFIPLYIKETKVDNLGEQVENILQSLDKNIKCDLMVWCCPKEEATYAFDNGDITPGIIMLAKKVNSLTVVK